MRDHGPVTAPTQPTVIVLAGGSSRRMGTDKRVLDIDGTPRLQRVIDGLPDATSILVVIDPDRPLPDDLVADGRIRVVHDRRTSKGPLGGIEAGLAATDDAMVLVLAVDMPWLAPSVLRLLAARLDSDRGADLACLMVDGRPQPFPMACRRGMTRMRTARLLDRGERRMRVLLDDSMTLAIGETEWRRADPSGRSALDIDTPADLARER